MDAALEAAVKRGDADAVRRLLDGGADVDSRDRHGQTALMRAAHLGHADVVETLVERGADLDVTAKFSLSALMLAVVAGHDAIARRLAAAGADLTLTGTGAPGFAGRTARDLALEQGRAELAAALAPADREASRPPRPAWALPASTFCAATVVFLAIRDLWVPHVRDTEVWLGIELTGWPARLTAPLHWLVFAAGAWGFLAWRPWLWPWAWVYAAYVAASHLVWNLTSPSGGGLDAGLFQLALFSVPALLLWWARPRRSAGAIPGSGTV